MDFRFHLVVANYCRARCFVDNFSVIGGFDPLKDAVIFLDCSPPEQSTAELRLVIDTLEPFGLTVGNNLFLVQRASRLVSHGAQLDYLKLVSKGALLAPKYTFFMQDHYLDRCVDAKEDVLPDNVALDLSAISNQFEKDPDLGCVFAARNGVRVSTSTPFEYREKYGDCDELLPEAQERCFLVDGGNFIVRPELYLPWLRENAHIAFGGLGDYGDAFVWEVRLGKILYDQKIRWLDLMNSVSYRTIDELRQHEARLNRSLSKRWYDNREWFALHGRDIAPYRMRPLGLFFRPLLYYLCARLRARAAGEPTLLANAPIPEVHE